MRGKMLRRLGLLMLIGSLLFSIMPASAGTSGTIGDSAQDVIDWVKHAQNSFRPYAPLGVQLPPYNAYQYGQLCGNPPTPGCSPDEVAAKAGKQDSRDLINSAVTTNVLAGTMTFTMRVNAPLPKDGDDVGQIPLPFTEGVYAWYFATESQNYRQKIGFNCIGDTETRKNNNTAAVGPVGKTGLEQDFTDNATNTTCPRALTTAHEAQGNASAGNQPTIRIADVTTPPHFDTDGWLGALVVEYSAVADDSVRGDCNLPTADDCRAAGRTVNCVNNAALCVGWDMQIGYYEGYSGVQVTNDLRDYTRQSKAKMSFTIVNDTVNHQGIITATIPFNPVTRVTDGDRFIDDERTFPWPFYDPAHPKFTRLVAEVTAVAGAGVNSIGEIQAVCLDNSYNPLPEAQEPFKTAGATAGQVNKAVNDNTTGGDPNSEDPVKKVKGTISQEWEGNDGKTGMWLWGTGGSENGDCIRGITGLITVLDWTDNGFEIRYSPRSPAYAPSTTSVSCKYPIGDRPLTAALVTTQIGPTNDPWFRVGDPPANPPPTGPTVGVSTSPYDEPWSNRIFVNGVQQGAVINGPVLPNPSASVRPLSGTIGKDQACGYTLVPTGLHYFDILPDFTM